MPRPALALASPFGRRPHSSWVLVATAFCLVALFPTASYGYDEAGLLGAAFRWLGAGVPLWNSWKFGIDFSFLTVVVASFQHLLVSTHLFSGVAATHVAFKVPLLAGVVLGAWSLTQLSADLGCSNSRAWGLRWVTSPAVVWVAVGHAQVEPLSIAALLLSCHLILTSRPVLAGFIAGMGAGVEYYPVGTLLGAVILANLGEYRWRQVAAAVAACVSALVFCFVPILAFADSRRGFLAQLTGTLGAQPAGASRPQLTPYGLSVWTAMNFKVGPSVALQALLLAVSVVGIAGLTIMAGRRRYLSPRNSAMFAVGWSTALLVILQPISSPQFAIIVAAGLILCSLSLNLSYSVGGALAAVGLFSYFVWETPWTFFYDYWGQRSIKLIHIPSSASLGHLLCQVFTFLTIACLVVAALSLWLPSVLTLLRSLGTLRYISMPVAAVALLSLSALAVLSGCWRYIGSNGPRYLVVFQGNPVNRTARGHMTIEAAIPFIVILVIVGTLVLRRKHPHPPGPAR